MPRVPLVSLRWYAARLLSIPNILDEAGGEERSRTIGTSIHTRFSLQGMQQVCEFIRDEFDYGTARAIERSWDGIGGWRS
jgi:hypothetical protein